METMIGGMILALHLATLPAMLRVFRTRPRPAWMEGQLTREYVMLAHMVLLLTGVCLLLAGLLQG